MLKHLYERHVEQLKHLYEFIRLHHRSLPRRSLAPSSQDRLGPRAQGPGGAASRSRGPGPSPRWEEARLGGRSGGPWWRTRSRGAWRCARGRAGGGGRPGVGVKGAGPTAEGRPPGPSQHGGRPRSRGPPRPLRGSGAAWIMLGGAAKPGAPYALG